MNYYTYKITFKDLPGYFYYGKHKCNGKVYLGSPVTWAHLWLCFEPEVQILQWYETAGEVRAAEEAIIRATWKDKYSLNENVSGVISEEICSSNGKKTGPENGRRNGGRTGQKNAKAMNNHPSTVKVRSENAVKNGEKASKRVCLTKLSTEESLEFPPLHEACRVLGLDRRHLVSVAKGGRKQHKGYTAAYV